MAHDGEEEEHFQPVDEDEDGEEDVEAGEGEIGESPQEGVSEERDPQHFGGEKEAGFQLPVFGMEEGKGKGQGDGTDDDEEEENQGKLLGGVHVRGWG